MKTLEDLNKKWWYRFLKVIYSFVFLMLLAGSLFVVYESNKSYQSADYSVKCNYGNMSSFIAGQDKGIIINNYVNNGSLTEAQNQQLRKACNISVQDIEKGLSAIYLGTGGPKAPFTLTELSIDNGGTESVLSYSLLVFVLLSGIFEIIKRSFYYISLGKINPEK